MWQILLVDSYTPFISFTYLLPFWKLSNKKLIFFRLHFIRGAHGTQFWPIWGLTCWSPTWGYHFCFLLTVGWSIGATQRTAAAIIEDDEKRKGLLFMASLKFPPLGFLDLTTYNLLLHKWKISVLVYIYYKAFWCSLYSASYHHYKVNPCYFTCVYLNAAIIIHSYKCMQLSIPLTG